MNVSLQRAFGWCIGLFLLVAATELAFRAVVFPDYRDLLQDVYTVHPTLGHFNRPNLEIRRFNPLNYDVINHTDTFGFRGRSADFAANVKGVWVAGSSNTFGGGVADDEVYVARLKGVGIAALNLASEGHNMPEQALVIRYLASLGHRPQAVVLELTMFHAIRDYTPKLDYLTAPLHGALSAPERARGANAIQTLTTASAELWESFPRSLMSLRASLIKTSAIYGWFKVGVAGIPSLRELTLKLGLRADRDLIFKMSPDLLEPLGPSNPSWPLIESTINYARAIGDLVEREFNVPFGIFLVPQPYHIYPETFERFVRHYGLQDRDLDPMRAVDAVYDGLRAKGLKVLDTRPALRAANREELFFPDDAHLNAKGHAVVASPLAQWIEQELGIVPKVPAP